jgi:hypothetical protein
MKIETLRPGLTEAYDRYLMGHSYSLLYHSSKYKDFLKNLLGCKEEYLLAIEGTDVCGVLPLMYTEGDRGRIYNSLPYYGSNGGVIVDNPVAYRALANAYSTIACSKTTISSTVVGNPFIQQGVSDLKCNYTDYRIGQFTDISWKDNPWDEFMARIDSSARRNVKKALRKGIKVEIDHTGMERLCQIHQDNIRAVGGIPKTNEFFALVPRHFTPGQDFDLYVAKKDGIMIAGLLIFYFNRTIEYFTPAITHEYRSLQPLALIVITAMVDVARRGFRWWNWGGTWASQTGVYRFKKKWAAMERKYYYYTQLNDLSILTWSRRKILSTFPDFFVVPFSQLNQGEKNE